MMQKYFTLITGGSSGIGRSLAMECAKRGMNIILAALPGPELGNTAGEIKSKYETDIRYFAIDLTRSDAPRELLNFCVENNLKVNFLINNAGIAGASSFEDSSPDYSDQRIMLNIRALAMMTRYFLPMIKECPDGKILNVGSLSGYFPVPYKCVYSASKAFVLSFSKSLDKELEGSGVRVFVLCPNGVESNSISAGRIKTHGFWGKITKISSDKLAVIALDSVEKGKKVIVPLLVNRLFLHTRKILPERLLMSLLEKEFRNEVSQ
jgi:short-subunit dehydrogenase